MSKHLSYIKLSFYSLIIAVLLLLLLETAVRVSYKFKQGVWPITLHQVVTEYREDIGMLFIEHSILPFVLRPKVSTTFMDTRVSVNSCGFRGPELSPSTPLRILVVGGSTTFDASVSSDNATWCAQLQEQLETPYPGVEVINAGLPIYGLMENFLKYVLYDYQTQPDIVLIYQGLNDLAISTPAELLDIYHEDYWMYRGVRGRKWSGLMGAYYPGYKTALNVNWFSHSVLLMGAYNQRGTNKNIFDNIVRIQTSDDVISESKLKQNIQILKYFLSALHSDGVYAVFVPQSTGSSNRRKVSSLRSDHGRRALKTLNRAYTEYCRDSGVAVIDVTEVLDTWEDEYFQDRVHLNDKGSYELARLIASQIRQHQEIHTIYTTNKKSSRNLPVTIQVLSKAIAVDKLSIHDVNLARLEALTSQGFGPLEGPYPEWNMPHKVRWMLHKKAVVRFVHQEDPSVKPVLRIKAMTMTKPQDLKVYLNGNLILDKHFPEANTWYTWDSKNATLQQGENILEFEASNFLRSENIRDTRSLYILFEEIMFK